jgi:predicted acyltransferase
MDKINTNHRVVSIDILRAVTMLLMIFVNDLGSLTNIPLWLEHTKANDDGMGLADTVFPAFLFIVGMSVPHAVAARKNRGDKNIDILWHIFLRSFALIIMGVFLVNGEYLNETATGMHRLVWNTISVTCFIVIWNKYPSRVNKTMVRILKMIAILVLLFLAFIFRAGNGGNISYFSTWWWGILGLIGWAYLVTALIYFAGKKSIYVITFSWIFFMMLCISCHAEWLPQNKFFNHLISPIGQGSMVALVLGGTIVSVLFNCAVKRYHYTRVLLLFGLMAAALLVAGFALRPLDGISKINATPSWVLLCSAITIAVFLLLYYVADVRKKERLFELIKPAGTNTLLCYLLPYYAYGIIALLIIRLPAFVLHGGIGLIKSFVFSLAIILITGWLGNKQVRLKL